MTKKDILLIFIMDNLSVVNLLTAMKSVKAKLVLFSLLLLNGKAMMFET